MVDSSLLSRVVEVQPAPVENADSVVAVTPEPEKAEVRPYNPYLNLKLTPSAMDSLVASWSESQSALAFDKFFADYIAIDSLPASSSSLPDSVYESRLKALASPIQLPYNSIVKNYINRYTDTRYGTINRILSLSQYYFPIIEEELLRAGLPVELRAMAIIESALTPTAMSPRGAVGLWQFMPYTGKSYGLEVNSLVDERRDAVLSTRAACKYMSDLYSIYNDWTLAIAAYNCGPGNVNKALARAGADCKTFWDIYWFQLPLHLFTRQSTNVFCRFNRKRRRQDYRLLFLSIYTSPARIRTAPVRAIQVTRSPSTSAEETMATTGLR
jgi:membrane-bound lytic murein transglycosylase D